MSGSVVLFAGIGFALTLLSDIGTNPSPTGYQAIVRDSLCYSTTREGIAVLDVSDPDSVRFVSTLATPGFPRHIDLADSLVYVADDYAGLAVVDISDPAAPVLLGRCTGMSDAYGVGHYGNLVYVTAFDNELLHVVDATDPTEPVLAGSVQVGATPTDILIDFPHLYLCAADFGTRVGTVQVYDITSPDSPQLLETLALPSFLSWDVAKRDSVLWVGSHLDGSSGPTLALVNVADPANPGLLGQYQPPDGAAVCDIALREDDTLGFLAAFTKNLVVINAADPAQPGLVSDLGVAGGQTEGLAVVGNHALLLQAGLEVGLVSVDVTDPSAPAQVGNLSGGSGYEDLVVVGDTCCVCRGNGVDIYHLGDVQNPAMLGHCPTPAYPWTVAVDSHVLYAYGSGALDIYDITNAASPLLLASCDTFQPWANLLARDNYLYYIGLLRNVGNTFFVCLDVSNPSAPTVAGKLQYTGRGPYEMAFDPGRPYVYASEYMLMRVYDVGNPSEPVEVAQCSLRGSGAGIAVDRQYAYIADYTEGLTVVDIADPVNPTVVGWYGDPLLRGAIGVAPIRNAVVVANGLRGLWLLDATDPQQMALADTADTPYSAHFLRRLNDTLLLQSDGCRVRVWSVSGTGISEADLGGPVRGTGLRIWPTCGGDAFTVSAPHEAGSLSALSVFAADGRLVGQLGEGYSVNGERRWHWRPECGNLASGVYYLVLAQPQSERSARVVLLR